MSEATLPTEITLALPFNLSQDEARILLAVKLYEVGRVSLGQAAKMAGFSRRAFMDVLGHYDVAVFNSSAEDLRHEMEL